MSEATLRDKKYITEPDRDNPDTYMAAVSVRCTSVYFSEIYFYDSAPIHRTYTSPGQFFEKLF